MWIKNTETGKEWFVSETQGKKWLKEDHFKAVSDQKASNSDQNGSKNEQKGDNGDQNPSKTDQTEVNSNQKPSDDEVSLTELKAAAKEQGIAGYTKMDKAQLEEALGELNGTE